MISEEIGKIQRNGGLEAKFSIPSEQHLSGIN